MKITLNLATRPYADQGPALKRLRIGMAVLAVVLAGLGLGLMHLHKAALAMAAQEDSINRRIAAIQQEEQGYEAQMQQPANAKVLTQAQFLNRLFEEKSFSWTAAMEDLERVLPAGVQVTAIEPSRGKDGRLTLRLRISALRERAVETVRNMEHSRRFVSPRITGESSEANGSQSDLMPVRDAGRVTFEVLAEYDPATLEERKAEISAQKRTHPGAGPQSLMPQSLVPRSLVPQLLAPQNNPRPVYVPPGLNPGSHPGYAGSLPPGAGAMRGRGQRPMNPMNPMNPTPTDPSAPGGPQ